MSAKPTADPGTDNRPSHPDCERCKVLPVDHYKREYYRRERAKTALYVSGAGLATLLVDNFPAILSLLKTLFLMWWR